MARDDDGYDPDEDPREVDGGEPDAPGVDPPAFALFVLLEGALAPFAAILGWILGQNPLDGFVWSWKATMQGAIATLPMFVFLYVTIRWPIGPFGSIKKFIQEEFIPALDGCGWHDLLLLSAAAGIGEELLIRGVLQGSLTRVFSPAVGIVIASILFGMLHPVSVAYLILATLMGAYLGAVLWVTGNILTVIVAHALYDFVAMIVLIRQSEAERPEQAD